MRQTLLCVAAAAGALLALGAVGPVQAQTTAPENAACSGPSQSPLAVSRIVEIDPSNGPIFGAFTKQAKEPSFLQPKEVVLTFDDGPMPWITKSILDTLDAYCAKATFFSVGRMALAYPDTVRDVIARGHTLGTHTMTHPFNMHRMNPSRAHREIEQGFAAVATAAGQPIAPFFRFTGLADSGPLLAYLATRQVATFTVDVVSNDSYINSPSRLTDKTLAAIKQNNGGIVLFHDIKASTAKALPGIMKGLAEGGFKIVHMRPTQIFVPQDDALEAVLPRLAKAKGADEGQSTLVPFYGAIHPTTDDAAHPPNVVTIAPAARERSKASPARTRAATKSSHKQTRKSKKRNAKSAGNNPWSPFLIP